MVCAAHFMRAEARGDTAAVLRQQLACHGSACGLPPNEAEVSVNLPSAAGGGAQNPCP